MSQPILLTTALRAEYERLFDSCVIRPDRKTSVIWFCQQVRRNRERYEGVVASMGGIPWWWVALVHGMESAFIFSKHLHNGDGLHGRTVRVPAGRPAAGKPPFTWEESALDALILKGLQKEADWSLANALYQLERYNGFGYRLYHKSVLSPYLWCFSNHYTRGKYVADGKWSATAISAQVGAAVALRHLVDTGEVCVCV